MLRHLRILKTKCCHYKGKCSLITDQRFIKFHLLHLPSNPSSEAAVRGEIAQGSADLGSNSDSAIYTLCDLEPTISPLWVSALQRHIWR